MHIYVDTLSPTPAPLIWDVTADEPRKPMRLAEYSTAFVVGKDELIDFFAVPKGPLAPTTGPISQAPASVATTPALTALEPVSSGQQTDQARQMSGSEIQKIAKQRVQLMAAAYARSADSSEILARLEILNHRLLDRSPRVSKEQVKALEIASEKLIELRSARELQAKRLGISI